MKDKKDKEIEKILMDDAAYNKLTKSKVELEFIQDIKEADNFCEKEITDIKDVPPDKLFSRYAVFEVLNKNSKTKSYINGIQAEGFLGTNHSDRESMLKGESSSFVSGNSFIKFIKIKV